MTWRDRTKAFCDRLGLKVPILLAPMAGVPAPKLSIAVARAGGFGSCGVLLMTPDQIKDWSAEAERGIGRKAFQLNLWIPDPPPKRDVVHEAQIRTFLERFGPPVAAAAGDATPPDFDAQCDAMLETGAPVLSSVMGLFPPAFVQRIKASGATWVAFVSTLAEAKQAEAAGADVIAVQGAEAGGHRAAFEAARADRRLVGLFSLLPAVADAVDLPVIAAGGIADGRGVAAALTLGASAVQVGTGFLRTPEAGVPAAWADGLGRARPEDAVVSRVFSGRFGRSLANAYVQAATAPDAPEPAPYPVQRALTAAMRSAAAKANDIDAIQGWAGQSAALARAEPAFDVTTRLWTEAQALLP